LTGDELEDYDRVVSRQAKLWAGAHTSSNEYFGALLNSPPLAAGLVDLGRKAREGEKRGYYSDAERELVDMVFSIDFGYNAILYLHIPDAIACGVRLEAIDALRAGREDELDDAERQIVDYARAVVNGQVTDARFAALSERLGSRGALEFTVFCGFLMMTFRLWMALGVTDPSDAEVDALLQTHRDGTALTVDPAARIG
jgi:alkylhydroperoxidase family enzyme